MNAELPRHTLHRADAELVLTAQLLEQFHLRSPVHTAPRTSTAGRRTRGHTRRRGPTFTSTGGPLFASDAVSGRRPCHYQGGQAGAALDPAVLPLPSATTPCGSSCHALAYNLANFLRSLALPREIESWSLTTLREKLVKIGARIVRHGRYVVFQLAEVAVPRALFAEILRRIERLRPRSPPLPA